MCEVDPLMLIMRATPTKGDRNGTIYLKVTYDQTKTIVSTISFLAYIASFSLC